MNTAIQARAPHGAITSMGAWQTMREQATVLLASGFLPQSVNTPEKALAIMMKGGELGIPPMYALSNITVISGKPVCGAELLLALVYRDHGDLAIQIEATTADTCTLSYARRSWPARKTYSFTIQDAKAAGLADSQTWRKYPAAMLRARCISAVARMAFADSIGGMYTPEELGARVTVDDATGEMHVVDIDTTALDVTEAPQQPAQRVLAEVAAPAPEPEPTPIHKSVLTRQDAESINAISRKLPQPWPDVTADPDGNKRARLAWLDAHGWPYSSFKEMSRAELDEALTQMRQEAVNLPEASA